MANKDVEDVAQQARRRALILGAATVFDLSGGLAQATSEGALGVKSSLYRDSQRIGFDFHRAAKTTVNAAKK